MSLFDDNLAIVASGRSLLHSGYGDAIDQYPQVLRFNRARVKDYEVDVGRYWTHWCCTFLDQSYPAVMRYPIQEVVSCEKPFRPTVKYVWKSLPTTNVMYMPPVMLDEICKRYAPSFYTPSSGLRLLWWIYRETGKKINRSRLFGFDCFGGGVRAGKKTRDEHVIVRKYYTNAKPSPRHRPVMERAIFDEITS